MKEILASVVVSRSSNHKIYLTVEAENGLRLLELEFTSEQFGNSLSALYTSGITAKLHDNYKICDAEYEVKQESIPILKYRKYETRVEDAKQHLKKFEIDGWKGRVGDVLNHHNIDGNRVQVTFSRFVEKKEVKEAEFY